jgi:Tol biopolymer transport system component
VKIPFSESLTVPIPYGSISKYCNWNWIGNDKILYMSYQGEVWMMNLDGSGKTHVLNLSSEQMPEIYDVRSSPDGKRLAFTAGVYRHMMRHFYLYVVNIDGTNMVKLSEGWSPSWSPDGSGIVFVNVTESSFRFGPEESNLCIMNSDGTDVRQLTDLPGLEWGPVWSADGRKIAFTNQLQDYGNVTVHVLNLDSGMETTIRLNSSAARESGLSWSLDSSVIVTSEGSDVCAFTVDGRIVRRIIANGSDPRTSYDGTRILYNRYSELRISTFNKPLGSQNLFEYTSIPSNPSKPPMQPEEDVLVNYKLELDNIEYTFNVSYRNYGQKGYDPEARARRVRFLHIAYTELNKGEKIVNSSLGTIYGLKLVFDDGSESDWGLGYGPIQPGELFSTGGIAQISIDMRLVALRIYDGATGSTIKKIPIPT